MALSRLNQPMDAKAEAYRLYKAMKGFGTDEKTIIDVMAHHPSHHRVEIARAFRAAYGKNLVDAFKSELSGNFYKTCRGLCYLLSEYDAICLREAMEGVGTDEEALIDILTARNSFQIRSIRGSYQILYHRNLESDVRSETSGNFGKVLVLLLTTNREERGALSQEMVYTDAQALYQAGAGRLGTDESTLNRIMCSRSVPHVAAVAAVYKQQRHSSLQDAIISETSGDYQKVLLSIVNFAEDQYKHVASLLHTSMKGAGTNDKRLQRTVIGFCESDMPAIKVAYQRYYGVSLANMIRGDTSGDYQKLLLTLIGDA